MCKSSVEIGLPLLTPPACGFTKTVPVSTEIGNETSNAGLSKQNSWVTGAAQYYMLLDWRDVPPRACRGVASERETRTQNHNLSVDSLWCSYITFFKLP